MAVRCLELFIQFRHLEIRLYTEYYGTPLSDYNTKVSNPTEESTRLKRARGYGGGVYKRGWGVGSFILMRGQPAVLAVMGLVCKMYSQPRSADVNEPSPKAWELSIARMDTVCCVKSTSSYY